MIWRAAALVLVLALAAAAVPAIRHLRERPPAPPPLIRSTLAPPDKAVFGAGNTILDAAISPGGDAVAFVATSQGRAQLWTQRLDDDRAQPQPGTEGASMPAWKAGGRVIAFFSDGALKQISLADRTVRTLAPAPTAAGAAWLSDGSLLFVPDSNGPVKQLRAGAVTDATVLHPGDRRHAFPAPAGDGGFIYMATRADGSRTMRYRRDEVETDLGTTSSHAELAAGAIVHVRDGVLLAQVMDPERHVLVGRATPLASSVGVSPDGRGFFAASPRVVLLAPAVSAARALTWFDDAGHKLAPIVEPGDYWQVRLSPDDRYAALTMLDPLLRTFDVFAVPLDAPANLARVSLSLGADTDPAWSPDSRRVAFRSAQRGASGVLARALGSSREDVLLKSESDDTPTDWQAGRLLMHRSSPATGRDVWVLDAARGTAAPITRGAFNEWDATWSPDGRWIAYVSDESGRPDIYVDAWPRGGRRVRLSFAGGARPQWGRDSLKIYFMRNNQIVRATRQSRDRIGFSAPEIVLEVDDLLDFAVAHRHARFAVLTGAHPAGTGVSTLIDWRGRLAPAR